MTPKAAFAGVWSICLEEFVPLLGVEARTQHVEGAGGGNERGSGGLSRDIGRPPGSESEWAHVSAKRAMDELAGTSRTMGGELRGH